MNAGSDRAMTSRCNKTVLDFIDMNYTWDSVSYTAVQMFTVGQPQCQGSVNFLLQ